MVEEKNYSSFISEHTAEYVLVPSLVKILKKRFSTVVPMYPWITREGTNLSKEIHQHDSFNVIGLFCKRPKIHVKDRNILFKINNDFLRTQEVSYDVGIPILVGIPLIKNLWQLSEKPNCIWAKLSEEIEPYYEIPNNDDLSDWLNLPDNGHLFSVDEDLLEYIENNTRLMNLVSFIESVRIIRRTNPSSLFGSGIYKPVYFLIK